MTSPDDAPSLLISLVQTVNGRYAVDGWSTGISTDEDFAEFRALRRSAGALILDSHTARHPQLPPINAPGRALAGTPVHVLSRGPVEALQSWFDERGLDYRVHAIPDREDPQAFSRDLEPLLASLERGDGPLLCESGPRLAFHLLDVVPGAELRLSISPRYLESAATSGGGLPADVPLRLCASEHRGDQVLLRYRRA